MISSVAIGFFLALVLASASADEALHHYDAAIAHAKRAELEEAELAFGRAARDGSSSTLRARALHSQGTLALISRGGAHGAAMAAAMHARAKALDPTAMPPLALLHQAGEECAGLSDIYWAASFSKKALHDAAAAADELGAARELADAAEGGGDGAGPRAPGYFEARSRAHVALATQLDDSGAPDLAARHWRDALELAPRDAALRVRAALGARALYGSRSALDADRARIEGAVGALLAEARRAREPFRLERLDDVAMPGTFYLVYHGRNDARLMADVQRMYAAAYPPLLGTAPWLLEPPPREPTAPLVAAARGARPPRLRVGFVSAHWRRHSVCKLLCGVVRHLPRDLFEVFIFSATDEADEDAFTAYARRADADGATNFTRLQRGTLLSNRALAADARLDVLVCEENG